MQQDLDPISASQLMSPVTLQSTRSATVLPHEERIRRKAEMAGIVKQLEFTPLVKNPWAALYHDTPLTARILPPNSPGSSSSSNSNSNSNTTAAATRSAGNSKTRWFFDAFAQAMPMFGVATSFLKTTTQTAAVHLPSTSTARKYFSVAEQKRLCSEHFQRIAFPAVTVQVEQYVPGYNLSGPSSIERETCPLMQLMDQAADQFVETSEERKQFAHNSGSNATDTHQDIVLWMHPLDRLKITQYVLQHHPAYITSVDRLPPLVLLLLLHLPAEERRQLAPRLKTDETYMHAIGGLVVGLPGFTQLDKDKDKNRDDLLYDPGSPSSPLLLGSSSVPSESIPVPSLSLVGSSSIPATCPLLNPLSASGLFFAFWSEYMRHQTVRLHHLDGLVMSMAAACITSTKEIQANRARSADFAAFDIASVMPHLFHLPRGVVTRVADQEALARVRSQNSILARAVDGDAAAFTYALVGMSMPDARFISAARRGCDYSAAERKAADGDALLRARLSPQKREWIRCSFRRISLKKVVNHLCRHGQLFKLAQLQQFQEAHKLTTLTAVLVEDAHGSDVVASLERILKPDRFFIATFAQEDSKKTHTYSGEYSSIVVAPSSAIWLYQRYAALRYYSPTNGVFNAKREEGVLTHRLPFAPTIMQLLESSDHHHQLAGISVLREWNGFKRFTPTDWTFSVQQLAARVLRMINACLVCEQLPRDDWPFMCKLVKALIAFDTNPAVAEAKTPPSVLFFWKPVLASNPLAQLMVADGSSKTFADKEEVLSHAQLLHEMQPILQSAEQRKPSLLLPALVEQLRTLRFEVKHQDVQAAVAMPHEKDAAFTPAALAVQISTAFPQERFDWCKTGCILAHTRCTVLYGCIMYQVLLSAMFLFDLFVFCRK